MDLYKFIFNSIGELKIAFLGDLMLNTEKVPFLKLFRELYIAGSKFALEHPRAIKITEFLLSNKDNVYDEVMKDGLNLASTFYRQSIETDQALGIISNEIDSDILTSLLLNMVINVTVDEVTKDNKELNIQNMINKIDKILFILEKGILTGEKNV